MADSSTRIAKRWKTRVPAKRAVVVVFVSFLFLRSSGAGGGLLSLGNAALLLSECVVFELLVFGLEGHGCSLAGDGERIETGHLIGVLQRIPLEAGVNGTLLLRAKRFLVDQ